MKLLSAGLLGLAVSAPLLASFSDPATADPLAFDPSRFTVRQITVDGRTVAYRAYENLHYVTRPADAALEVMNVYVPVEYYGGGSVNGFTADTAPIFMPNTVGGYMPGPASGPALGGRGPGGMPGLPPGAMPPGGVPAQAPAPGGPPPDLGPVPGQAGAAGAGAPTGQAKPNAMAVALSKGYVVASPGVRGRTSKDASGAYTGKAPAFIVDLKAAVRYLRHNDKVMPGNAERILSNGTSAGGALSALIGATGNAADYEPYLKALGAAEERDDIFAASCYCPITDLDHADAAYEWLFNGQDSYDQRGSKGALTPQQIRISAELKARFPAYLNSLGLRRADGSALTLDEAGNGSFSQLVQSLILDSARQAALKGADLSKLDWLTLRDGVPVGMDLATFAAYAGRQKAPPAFDSLSGRSPENNVFGNATTDSRHFTAFAAENSTDKTLAEPALVRMMNPLSYLGAKGVTPAPHWRIRHGTIDRDTSLAIPVLLATRLANVGLDVDFALPWNRGHSGDYDLDELFAWMDHLCR